MNKNFIILGIACLALFSCDNRDKRPSASFQGDNSTTFAQSAKDDYDTETDRAILQRIRQNLQNDNQLARPAQRIGIVVSNGEVTITGFVTNRQDKERIARRIQETNGARQINNRLEIGSDTSYALINIDDEIDEDDEEDTQVSTETQTSTYPGDKFTNNNDRQLLQRIREILIRDPNLTADARAIAIFVDNGNVVLTGFVSSDKQRVLLVNKIRPLNGVRNIDNRLKANAQAYQSRYAPYYNPYTQPNRGYSYYYQQPNNGYTSYNPWSKNQNNGGYYE